METLREVLEFNTVVRYEGEDDFVPAERFAESNYWGIKLIVTRGFSKIFLHEQFRPVQLFPCEIAAFQIRKPEISDREVVNLIGREKLAFPWAYIHFLLSLQPNLELGPVLLGGASNFFYVPHPRSDRLLRVCLIDRKLGDFWTLEVDELGSKRKCQSLDQIFLWWR